MERVRADIVLAGGGGAAMTLLLHVCLTRQRRPRRADGDTTLVVAVVDPVDRLEKRPRDRTWCFWERRGPGAETPTSGLGGAVEQAWTSLLVHGPDDSIEVDLEAAGTCYAMVPSDAFYALVADAVTDPASGVEVHWLTEEVEQVVDGVQLARVTTARSVVESDWVFDSTPPRPTPRSRTALLQHFKGVVVRTSPGCFDPRKAVLMDLRIPQPRQGLSFGYCLPLAHDRALVEYTEFSRSRLDDAGYDEALDAYLEAVAGPADQRHVDHTETGAIPMSDARHRTRAGRRVFRVGTAGGATRPSTGYAFAAMNRQALGVAALLQTGQVPVPPAAYPASHRLVDAVLLRGLDDGGVDGTRFFPHLFARNPPARVLDFLDGVSSWRDYLAVVRSVPPLPMLHAAASLVARPARR